MTTCWRPASATTSIRCSISCWAAEKLSSEVLLKKAEETSFLEEENQQLKQKVAEAALTASKVAELEKRVEELQKPKGFWHKFFGGQ